MKGELLLSLVTTWEKDIIKSSRRWWKEEAQNREKKTTSNKVLISNLSNSSEPVSKRRSVTERERERAIENAEKYSTNCQVEAC
jgi:hypothetical protein